MITLIFSGVFCGDPFGISEAAKKSAGKPNPLTAPFAGEQNTIIQTQNAYHYDEDLTSSIVSRQKRTFLIDSVGKIIDDLDQKVSDIEGTFNQNMSKIQAAVNSEIQKEESNGRI